MIHGGWHGAWCWDKVAPLLERDGHEVVRFDLPGHGADQTPAAEVTLQSYTDRVVEALDAQSEPVVLVGHSLGGVAISQAAEQRPEKINKLVYVCALLLPSGKSASEASQGDSGSVVFNNVEVQPDLGRIVISEAGLRKAFYHDCPEEDFQRALGLSTPQPIAPLGTPIEVTEGNFGSVRRTYVHTTQDRTPAPPPRRRCTPSCPARRSSRWRPDTYRSSPPLKNWPDTSTPWRSSSKRAGLDLPKASLPAPRTRRRTPRRGPHHSSKEPAEIELHVPRRGQRR